MEPNYDVNLDCLRSLISKAPLKERLFTLCQVNSQWKTAVADLCATQKKLTLQIGSRNKWENIFKNIKCEKLLINAVSPFDTLTVARLTEERATYLTSTFPRLESLAVVIDNQTTDAHFLRFLPLLISAYSSTLTTLQFVLNVNHTRFQPAFRPIIASIDCLRQLKGLSFVDCSECLSYLKNFDLFLPHLLSNSLDILDIYSIESTPDFARYWVDSLQARSRNNPTSLMKINLFVGVSLNFPLYLPASVAAHFYFVNAYLKTTAELEHLTSAFTNLRSLALFLSDFLSVGDVLVQLARLPHLTDLDLGDCKLEMIVCTANGLLPVLPTIRRLTLTLRDQELLHDQVNNVEALRLWEVFPSAQQVFLNSYTCNCESCGWQAERVSSDDVHKFQLVKGSEQLMEQCITRSVTSFVSNKAKPSSVAVSFRVLAKENYTFSFDDNGQVKQLIKS